MTGIVIAIVLANTGLHSPYAFFMPLALIGVGNGVTLPSSNAGMVSVKPHLAGSASGLGGALTIGGGAALSVIATSLLSPTSGTQPLLFMMVATGLLALYATYFTRKAERQEASLSQRDDNA
jgi:DHA1 family bicyclomycin/chloramphenicol resistance-like MFS transporter